MASKVPYLLTYEPRLAPEGPTHPLIANVPLKLVSDIPPNISKYCDFQITEKSIRTETVFRGDDSGPYWGKCIGSLLCADSPVALLNLMFRTIILR